MKTLMAAWPKALSLSLIAGLVLAACGPTAPATDAEPEASAGQERVTLTFIKIADELEAQAFDELVTAFQQSEDGRYSYVDVEYDTHPFGELFTAIETAVGTGQPVDIIQADGPNMINFVANDVIMDVTEHYSAEELALWTPQSVAEATVNERFYGPPLRQSCSVMWYNPALTEAAGIEVPETVPGWTYEEALEAWKATTIDENGDGVPEIYGVELGQLPYWGDYEYRTGVRTAGEPGSPTYEGVGPDGLTFDGYFNTPEAIEAFQFIQDLYTVHNVATAEPLPNAFLSGRAAFHIAPDRVIGVRNDQFPDVEIRATSAPYFVTPLCHTGSWHYAIASTTDHFEEALAFTKFAASDEGARIYYSYLQQMPANINLLNELPEWQEYPRSLILDFFTQYGQPRIQTPAYTEFDALYQEFYVSLMSGAPVEELANEYAGLMDEAAARYQGQGE